MRTTRNPTSEVTVDCPCCKVSRIRVRMEFPRDSEPVAAETWQECECVDSKLVDQGAYCAELEMAALATMGEADEDARERSLYGRYPERV